MNEELHPPAEDMTPEPGSSDQPGMTESRNPRSSSIDSLSPLEIATLINQEDAAIAPAVETQLNEIAWVMELVADAFRGDGRLIYVGAGTSGRLGVLDASECPPTFNTDPDQVVGVIAGGHGALVRSIEGAEDSPAAGALAMDELSVKPADVVVGIATSGRTPFVIGALRRAGELGAATAGLVCNELTAMTGIVDVLIQPIVGPEVISGSTRLKAGTATKLVLNMITTGAMVLVGKTFGNLMVDLRASNGKLRDRTERIVVELTGLEPIEAQQLLERCDGELKTAIVCELGGVEPSTARERLETCDGRLRETLDLPKT